MGSNPTARTRYSYKSLSFLLWRFTFKWNAFFGEYGREVMRRIVVPVYEGPSPSIHPLSAVSISVMHTTFNRG